MRCAKFQIRNQNEFISIPIDWSFESFDGRIVDLFDVNYFLTRDNIKEWLRIMKWKWNINQSLF